METEVKKITTEQLEKINAGQKELYDIIHGIGILESQKHAKLHQLAEINKNIEDFKSEIETEYGPININLQDGSYTEIEKIEKTE